jgi:hypothetical protein
MISNIVIAATMLCIRWQTINRSSEIYRLCSITSKIWCCLWTSKFLPWYWVSCLIQLMPETWGCFPQDVTFSCLCSCFFSKWQRFEVKCPHLLEKDGSMSAIHFSGVSERQPITWWQVHHRAHESQYSRGRKRKNLCHLMVPGNPGTILSFSIKENERKLKNCQALGLLRTSSNYIL